MAKTSPAQFVRQVRQETSKVTFPTRKETMVSALMVLVLVTIMAIFFLVTDNIIQFFVRSLLGFGG